MADIQSSFAPVLAALAHDPGFRDFARADAALLLWDLEGGRLLWNSPPAAALREALAEDEEGRVSPSLPARLQLRALGQGLAPSSGARLERLRFDPSRLTPPMTCACRRVTLSSGEGALLTAVLGPVPKLARGGAGPCLRPAAPAKVEQDASPHHARRGRSEAEPLDLDRLQRLGTVRFLWHTDASGRFTFRSDTLADVVGAASAAIVGHTWDEIAGTLVLDLHSEVSDLFAAGKTWSGQTVLWRIAGIDRAVPVDLAAAAVFSRDRGFLGFRGFGLCRTEILSEWRLDPRPAGVAAPGRAPRPAQRRPTPDQSPGQEHAQPALIQSKELPAVVEPYSNPARTAPIAPQARPHEHRSFPHLSAEERTAFREIARALGARFEEIESPPDRTRPAAEVVTVYPKQPTDPRALEVLDSLPVALLVYRGEIPLFANRLLLDLTGYDDVSALAHDGGLARLFPGRLASLASSDEPGRPTMLSRAGHESIPVDVRSASVQWEGQPATAMVVRRVADDDPAAGLRALDLDLRASDARVRELTAILDMATDGVVVLDEAWRILSLNRSAEALFGYDQREIAGESVTTLLAVESHGLALDYLDGLRGVARVLNDGREVLGRVRQGGAIPLLMTAGRTSEGPERRFCMVLRDITALRKAQAELLAANRTAQGASTERSDFLAKVSHELRTPLNVIIGFTEVMLEERFGALGNERYRDYLKDIHDSGRRVVGLMNDLLDLAKIEAGGIELTFAGVSLNEIAASSVATLVHQAARERIVMRTSFAPQLPPVLADERSLRQILLNVLSNAVKFTPAGGQVIVSSAITDRGEVVVRVRDTGIGMTDQEVEAALEPLRQIATARKGGGTGLGLPLAKALVEANRGTLHITSAPNEGTLVEIGFPPTRVLAG